MKMTKLITAALLTFTTVACTADERGSAQEQVDYTGLFDAHALDVAAADIVDGLATSELMLPSGSSVTASISRVGGAALEPGRYTIQLNPDSLIRLDDARQPISATADEASLVLNDRSAEPVCGVYTLAGSAQVTTASGEEFPVSVSLASTAQFRQYLATATATADKGKIKGCKFMVEPKESCGGDCTISIWIQEWSGTCDGTLRDVPWYQDGKLIWVPMKFCYCNTSK